MLRILETRLTQATPGNYLFQLSGKLFTETGSFYRVGHRTIAHGSGETTLELNAKITTVTDEIVTELSQ